MLMCLPAREEVGGAGEEGQGGRLLVRSEVVR